jgi:hypothetical protein
MPLEEVPMISDHSRTVAEKAKHIYAEQLQSKLEGEHHNQFVAVEPESGEHFIASSFSDAVASARSAHPDRISFVIRIGHDTALHIGGISN